MSLERIVSLLNERVGLDAHSIGMPTVARAIQRRGALCAAATPADYWDRLQSSPEELQALIEEVVVPESWFFRDREAFRTLTRVMLPEWLHSGPNGPMRLLSLPCAGGEEPFSMAMALLDAGLPRERFQIEAMDVSRRAIRVAERGEYGRNAFREADLSFRDRYFEPIDSGFRLSEAVRRTVQFRHANLIDALVHPGGEAYDVVFCRNLLIYFDRGSQRKAVRSLGRMLRSTGMLFVGPSEGALLLGQGFVSARVPLAFCFRRSTARSPPSRPRVTSAARTAATAALLPGAVAPAKLASGVAARRAEPVRGEPAPIEDWCAAARRLADEGQLSEALQLCEQHLREAPSADGYCLSAVIQEASGRHRQALEHYRRALYLDPAHQEALVHLGTALIRDGAAPEAQRLFARAERARNAGR